MVTTSDLRTHAHAVLDALPDAALPEVTEFLERQQDEAKPSEPGEPPYVPVKLGGILIGQKVTDEDIAEVRREMWEGFGERDL